MNNEHQNGFNIIPLENGTFEIWCYGRIIDVVNTWDEAEELIPLPEEF